MNTERLTVELAKIPSVTSDVAAVNRCVEFAAAYARKQGLFVRIERLEGRKILYAANHPGKNSELLLNAHLDVVPAPPEQFKPRRSGRWLYGRGVGDNKASCAVILNLLPRLKGLVPAGAVFSTDEETGGRTAACMARKGYGGRFTLVLDGNFDRVITAQKGILSLVLTARGRACHAATPWRGDNALDRLVDGYVKIRNLFPRASERRSWRPTLAATILRAGEVSNQVPGTATLTLNIRFTEETDPDAVERRIRRLSGLAVHRTGYSPFVRVPETHPFIRALTRDLRATMNPRLRTGRMNGATDLRHFLKSEALAILGPRSRGAHSTGERVDLPSVRAFEAALFRFARKRLVLTSGKRVLYL